MIDVGRMVDRVEPQFRAEVLAVIRTIQDRYTLGQLSDLIQSGRVEEAMRFVEVAARRLGAAWQGTYQSAGAETALAVNRSIGSFAVSFDMTNTRAITAARANQIRLVREFSTEQRRATRQALLEGITRGANPIEQARNFRDSIGLTSYQERAVANYRRALEMGSSQALERQLRDRRFDRTVARAIEGEAPLSRGQIDTMVERYRERYVKYRSEVIARTESMSAAAEGARESYIQAVESGDLSPQRVTRTWNTAGDKRVRDSHETMDGQTVGYDEPFTTGSGHRVRYPGDPAAPPEERIQCRCSVSTRIAAAPEAGPVRISVFGDLS